MLYGGLLGILLLLYNGMTDTACVSIGKDYHQQWKNGLHVFNFLVSMLHKRRIDMTVRLSV